MSPRKMINQNNNNNNPLKSSWNYYPRIYTVYLPQKPICLKKRVRAYESENLLLYFHRPLTGHWSNEVSLYVI